MARLAHIKRRQAQLLAEQSDLAAQESAVFTELAEGETVDLRSGRQSPRAPLPELPKVSETDQARALSAIRISRQRRRVGL
jgi:hypothetical protein